MITHICFMTWLMLMFIAQVFAAETIYEAAAIARRLVDHSANSVGTMGTVFPSDHPTLPDQPFTLQEYYASCHRNGSLTLLFLPISRQSQNILHSPNHAASLSIMSEIPAAKNARVSLMGNVTIFKDTVDIPDLPSIRRCYLEKHPDAKWWLPDDDRAAHKSYWARFDPQTIYFVGGFGDEHYIGFIPLHLYQEAAFGNERVSSPEVGIAGRILVEQV
ncbi:hypothetical protein AX17_001429 [Amanita inopinata Kibby_2008]|nr:hypothetical protein AX17_001429 [Amanita inopinata Kibby_2008]